MIRWCAYCQRLMPEKAPLTAFGLTHSICERCDARVEAGETPEAEHADALVLYRALFAAARRGEREGSAAAARAALDAGLSELEILVGLVQPALVEIGERWERGEATVEDEHRFTAWCAAMVAELGPPPELDGPPELLILAAPGNTHTLGARIAERALRAHGVRACAWLDAPALDDVVAFCHVQAPAWLGFSCALAATIHDSRAFAEALAARGVRPRVLVSGQAVRRGAAAWHGAIACPRIEDARDVIVAAR